MLSSLGTSPWRFCTPRQAYRLSSPHTVTARLRPWSPCLNPEEGCRQGDDANTGRVQLDFHDGLLDHKGGHHFFTNLRRQPQLRDLADRSRDPVRKGGSGHGSLSSDRPRHRSTTWICLRRVRGCGNGLRGDRATRWHRAQRTKSPGQRGPGPCATATRGRGVHERRPAVHGLRAPTRETERQPSRPSRPKTRVLGGFPRSMQPVAGGEAPRC